MAQSLETISGIADNLGVDNTSGLIQRLEQLQDGEFPTQLTPKLYTSVEDGSGVEFDTKTGVATLSYETETGAKVTVNINSLGEVTASLADTASQQGGSQETSDIGVFIVRKDRQAKTTKQITFGEVTPLYEKYDPNDPPSDLTLNPGDKLIVGDNKVGNIIQLRRGKLDNLNEAGYHVQERWDQQDTGVYTSIRATEFLGTPDVYFGRQLSREGVENYKSNTDVLKDNLNGLDTAELDTLKNVYATLISAPKTAKALSDAVETYVVLTEHPDLTWGERNVTAYYGKDPYDRTPQEISNPLTDVEWPKAPKTHSENDIGLWHTYGSQRSAAVEGSSDLNIPSFIEQNIAEGNRLGESTLGDVIFGMAHDEQLSQQEVSALAAMPDSIAQMKVAELARLLQRVRLIEVTPESGYVSGLNRHNSEIRGESIPEEGPDMFSNDTVYLMNKIFEGQ